MTRKKPIRAERRHNIRINGSFCVQIVGVDAEPGMRRGNISVSGIYFEYDQEVGQPGSICRLRIAASEGSDFIDVMTRLVRVVSYTDLWRGTLVAGIAFEFMLQNQKQGEGISRLIKEAAELQIKRARGLRVDYPLDARVNIEDHKNQEATLRSLSRESMTLETGWPVRVGESIHLVIEAPESRRQIRLNGRVTRSDNLSEEGAVRFAHQVDFSDPSRKADKPDGPASSGPRGYSIVDAVDGLLAEIITAHPDSPRVDPRLPFCGRLSQVTLPGLLGFFEIERVSGMLKLKQKDAQAIVFLRDGRVIDVESTPPIPEALEILSEISSWPDAIFEFSGQPVEKADRIGLATSELLTRLESWAPKPTPE